MNEEIDTSSKSSRFNSSNESENTSKESKKKSVNDELSKSKSERYTEKNFNESSIRNTPVFPSKSKSKIGPQPPIWSEPKD